MQGRTHQVAPDAPALVAPVLAGAEAAAGAARHGTGLTGAPGAIIF